MRTPRIYHPEMITQPGQLTLSEEAAGHVGRVLRFIELLQLFQVLRFFELS